MKGQKQSRTDNLEKRMAAVTNVLQHALDEIAMLKNLAVGTLETIKLMPNYAKAIKELQKKAASESSEAKKAKSSGEDSE